MYLYVFAYALVLIWWEFLVKNGVSGTNTFILCVSVKMFVLRAYVTRRIDWPESVNGYAQVVRQREATSVNRVHFAYYKASFHSEFWALQSNYNLRLHFSNDIFLFLNF